jgi:nickel-dependent lactate racemase
MSDRGKLLAAGASYNKCMRSGIDYGNDRLDLEVDDGKLVAVHRDVPAQPLADPAAAVRAALETPLGFPALRRALTPADHVAVVLDEHLPQVVSLLIPVLEHIADAQVAPAAITIVCPPSVYRQEWVNGLPERFESVRVEVHDATNRQRLSYLATTKRGRRIYLNRTVVDADQLVVLSGRGYDALLGYSGAEGALYPALSDEATRQEMFTHLSMAVPGEKIWPLRKEAAEVAWLLGAPFMIHVVEGAGESVTHVVSGLAETGAEALRLLNARWRVSVDRLADLVIAAVGGDPRRHTFADVADALAAAARVVKPQGRIVLLTRANPSLGAGAELLREADEVEEALGQLRRRTPPDMAAAFQWVSAARRATIYLLSDLPTEAAEELFTTPLEQVGQVQRLIDQARDVLVLQDAHKTLAVPPEASI